MKKYVQCEYCEYEWIPPQELEDDVACPICGAPYDPENEIESDLDDEDDKTFVESYNGDED